MDGYSVFEDFTHYINENEEIIRFLDENDSLLDEFVSPIIRTLNYLKKLKDLHGEELNKEDQGIFTFGFEYLFENVEQIKLYFKGLDEDYLALEQNSYYIKMVFQLEELKVEIEKNQSVNDDKKELDIKQIELARNYFEDLISVDEQPIDNTQLNNYLSVFEDIYQRYTDIVLLTDAFNQYCATYGI